MTFINTTSLQQIFPLFNGYSSHHISDEYKKNLYLAQIARENRRVSTQNSVENVVETAQEEQNVSSLSDEVTVSKSTEYSTPKPRVNTPTLKSNTSENNQTYDDTVNQLKARKNRLQQELNRLNQQGINQSTSPDQEEERETMQDVDATSLPTNRLMTEEAPLVNVLKRQINEIEKELYKNRNKSTIGENIKSTERLSLSQLQQKKARLEQQLRNLENETLRPRGMAQDTNRTTIREPLEEQEESSYQNHLEELRIKQEIRNLESKINVLERKRIVKKTHAALNEIRNISNEATHMENHLIDIEV